MNRKSSDYGPLTLITCIVIYEIKNRIMDFLRQLWKSKLYRCLLLLLTAVVVYNEWIAMQLTINTWQHMPLVRSPLIPADTHHDGVPVRVLFVADPQLLTTLTEPHYPFSIISVWDANRFLKNGFNAAMQAARPDVVVFLGDLLNDGSIADDKQFSSMVQHFHSVFRIPDAVKLQIHIPGDNDVGGEGKDRLTRVKMERFQQAFPDTKESRRYKFLQFVHVPPQVGAPPSRSPPLPGVFRVLLSHVPLMPGTAHKKIIKAERPSLVMSGHHHDSFHFVGLKSDPHAVQFWPLYGADLALNLSLLTKNLNELVVPTCSYRMGKDSYGYGLAVIDSRGWLQYTVLWLPARFPQLLLYCCAVAVVALVLLLPRLLRGGWWLLGWLGGLWQLLRYKSLKNNA